MIIQKQHELIDTQSVHRIRIRRWSCIITVSIKLMYAQTWFWTHQGKQVCGNKPLTTYDGALLILYVALQYTRKLQNGVYTMAGQLSREGSDAYDYPLRLLGQVKY